MGLETIPQPKPKQESLDNREQILSRAGELAKLAEEKLIEKFGSIEAAKEIAKQEKTWNGTYNDPPGSQNWEIFERDKKAESARIMLDQINKLDKLGRGIQENKPPIVGTYGGQLRQIEEWLGRAESGDFILTPTGKRGPAFG